MAGALSGLRVVEHARGSAAAYAGRLFAVCGADVTIAEPPDGTPLRRVAPFLPTDPPVSALFAYLGVAKSSVVCDLETPEGRAALDELLCDADVLLDDTPVAKRAALGLDPQRIARAFPRLVFVSILPFGAFGPRAPWRATELCSLHAGGEGYLMPNGLANELFPDREPVKIYGEFANFQGGTAAAIAALGALFAGTGEFIDISIQDANVLESTVSLQRWGDGVLETRPTRSFRYGGVLPCADGYVEVLTLEQHQWEALAKLAGESAWAENGEFDDPLERGKRGAEINRHLREWARSQRVADVLRRGRELGVPIAPFAPPRDVLEDPHERERGLFAELSLAGEPTHRMLLAPFQFSVTPTALRFGPPRLDEDTRDGAAMHA